MEILEESISSKRRECKVEESVYVKVRRKCSSVRNGSVPVCGRNAK